MAFLDTYMSLFSAGVALVISVGAALVVVAMCAALVSSALYGLTRLILSATNIKIAYTKVFTVYAIFAVLLFVPLGITSFLSVSANFNRADAAREYAKGWVLQEHRAEQFMLVRLDPPKHVYVTLKHVATGTLYEHQYVSKHCNSHTSNKIGDVYTIRYDYYKHSVSGATQIVFQNLYDVFCN